MPAKAEYEVLEGPANQVRTQLNRLAQEGYKPTLMSSVATEAGIMITVILEHVLGA